jgi:N-acetylglucosamine kinase-like BadF-type ATPase
MKYIGIDGGGTKTMFCLMDDSLTVLSEYQTTGCYYPDIGKDGIVDLIFGGIETLLKSAGIETMENPEEMLDISAYCGIPAYGELDSLMADLPEIKKRIPVKIEFCNDAEICHAGALNAKAGIAVIAGTGSIAFGRDESGGTARSGGFGSEMNCDEGSAHYIGLKLIQHFTRQADFREERTLLYDEVKKELGLKKDIDMYAYMVEDIKMNREIIAGYAMFAHTLALNGDPVCKSIFFDAAKEICLMAEAVKKQLKFSSSPVKVSYAGGVFKSGDALLPKLSNLLRKKNMILRAPKFQPAIGACLMAKNSRI